MKRLLLALLFFEHGFAIAEDNLRYFVGEAPHPLCGINPSFDGNPQNVPPPPFAKCRTLAIGYGIDKSYPDPGVDALSKLIVAISDAGGWEQRFGSLSKPPLNCRLTLPRGMGTPGAPLPLCTVGFVKAYLVAYDNQPLVLAFRRVERSIQRLDLLNQATIDKVKQAEAVVRATGPKITFRDVAELLE